MSKPAWKRRLKRAALVAAVILVSLLICEIVLQCLNIPGEVEQDWLLQSTARRKRIFDPDTLFSNPEFAREDHYRAKPGEKTIVALGDSFTEGFRISAAESYLGVLQDYLSRRNIKARIINMGIGYSGNDQHLAVMKHIVLPRLKPDLVIWQFFFNDLYENTDLSLYRIDGDSRLVHHGITWNWLYMREKICRWIPGPIEWIKKIQLVRLLLRATNNLRTVYIPEEQKKSPLAYSFRKSQLIVEEMVNLSEKHGFQLVFVLADLQGEHLVAEGKSYTDPSNTSFWCHNALRTMLSTRQGFIDTHFSSADLPVVNARFSTRLTSVGKDLFMSGEKDFSFPGARHFNRYGCWLFATTIGDFLVANRDELFPVRPER